MRIEAVIICVDYADFLEQTLPSTLEEVDDLVVVTTPEDGATRGLCHKMGVRCLPTRSFYQWGDKFNKARGINYGLANLRLDDWVLHLDADIVLPPRSRWLLSVTSPDPSKIYGVDRFDLVGREAWDAHCFDPGAQYVHSCRVQAPSRLAMGSRLLHVGYGGYCPIGYFQLWNPRASGIDRYPETSPGIDVSAERTDVLHAIQWDRADRVLVPELIVLHLSTKGNTAPMGGNWGGRTSPAFTLKEGPYRRSSAPTAAKPARCY